MLRAALSIEGSNKQIPCTAFVLVHAFIVEKMDSSSGDLISLDRCLEDFYT